MIVTFDQDKKYDSLLESEDIRVYHIQSEQPLQQKQPVVKQLLSKQGVERIYTRLMSAIVIIITIIQEPEKLKG